MAYLRDRSDSDGDSTESSELSFLGSGDDDKLPPEMREQNKKGRFPKKKVLTSQQQSRLLVKQDPVGLFGPEKEKSTRIFKRERRKKIHYELDPEPNPGREVSIHGKEPKNPYFEHKWARTAQELQIPVVGDRRRGYRIRKKENELKWRPDNELLTPPVDEPTSHSIYEDGYQNPEVHIPLRIEEFATPNRRETYVPLILPSVHALEGGIVHVFDSRSLRTYRLFDRQEFFLIASLRFDEMLPEEQLTCLSFCPTRHSVALGFADGNAAICRVEIDNSTQIGRGRHNFEYVMAPAEPHLVITKIEQHPCTPRFVALCYYDAPRMSYVIRVIDQDRVLDKENTVMQASDKEREFFSQYPDQEDKFGARQGPFRTVDGKESIPMMAPKQHSRVLSVRTVERVTDLMWFSDRRNLLMVFTERTMRLLDISKEGKEKLMKSCTLARPLTRPSVHPGRPSLFSALDRHQVVLYDRRCFKSPVMIVDVPGDALSRGIPSLATWCPTDMNKLFVHYRSSQRAAIVQFNRYPDCRQLSDGACEEEEIGPVFNQIPKSTADAGAKEFRWPYNVNDEFPVTFTDHFIAEDDLEGGLMEAVPFPTEWKDKETAFIWKPEFEVSTMPFAGHTSTMRRVQSSPDVTTADDDGNFVHPFKRYVKVARDRRDESVFNECVEWKIWEQLNSLSKRRSKSEERPRKSAALRSRYAEEEDLCRPFPVMKTSPYLPHLKKNEVVYPVFTSEFVDVPELEIILKMKKPEKKRLEYFHKKSPMKVPFQRDDIDYENVDQRQPPGAVIPIYKRDRRFDVPLNHTRIPICHGGMYYGIQGRPLKQMRSTMDHTKFYDTHDDTRNAELTNAKKKRLLKEWRRDEIMRMIIDEEQDLMKAVDCRWMKHHMMVAGSCEPSEPKNDPFVQRLRKSRLQDSDDSSDNSSIDPHDDSFRRNNDIRTITKNDFPFVDERSLFDVSAVQKRTTTAAWNTHLLELPVEDPQFFCFFAYSMEMIVQGAPSDVQFAPNSVIMKIVIDDYSPLEAQKKLCFPQVADMSAYLRSVLGMNSLQSVKIVKQSGFGEFKGEDIPKGYIDTLKHLRENLEDSDGNRFALDYIERLFNDNHIVDYDRGFPKRFEVPDPVYSDTTDEDDPKKKKKKSVFAASDDRPKMEQLKEKLYKKKRAKFLKKRRACEELKLDYNSIFPQAEVMKQKTLCELYDKGDPKRTILQDPVPGKVYELYSGSSDSNEEAHYLPKVTVKQFPKRENYDFEEEEQIIARETKEINIIQQYRKSGRIPPFEFTYDEDGRMLRPKCATLQQEYHLNVQTTRTLLRRMIERDARLHELKRRKEMALDRLPEEVAEDTYDHMMSDLKVLFDDLEDHECNLMMTGDFFKMRRKRKHRTVYGHGWRRNRKLQHKFLNKALDLCDYVCKIRRQFAEHEENEKMKRRQMRKAQKEAKILLREISRRDIAGTYTRVMQEHQFRRNAQHRDYDIYDFLDAFEETTLKMCGRQYASHHELIRSMTHLRKDRFDRMDPRYKKDMRPPYTEESDSDFGDLDVSTDSPHSSSSLSGQPLIMPDRQKKLVKRRRKDRKERTPATEESDVNEEELERRLVVQPGEGEPVSLCEILENHPPVLLPKNEDCFYEKEAASIPISSLAVNRCDPLRQLASYNREDIRPPARYKNGRPKRIKNRKQRNKRDRAIWFAEQKVMKEARIAREKLAMGEIVDLMEKIHISTPMERETEWRRKREKRMKDGMKSVVNSPRSTPHRSLTRKLLDKLRIGGGLRPIRVYANGSIYPPSKIQHAKIFDRFDPYTNPFARKPAANPDGDRPRPTFIDDGNIEIGVAVDTSHDRGIFPPDEFAYPLRIGEMIPNNVEWMFPRYWAKKITRREKQLRKRTRRFLDGGKGKEKIWKIDKKEKEEPIDYELESDSDNDEDSISTLTTILNSSWNEIPMLTEDEKFMAKYICISNPALVRSLSVIEISTRDDYNDLPLRPRSCMGRLTEEMESLDDVEAAFAGSMELPAPPGLMIDEEGRQVWNHEWKSLEESRPLPRNSMEDFTDLRPMNFLLSPLHSSDESEDDFLDDDVTPVPPVVASDGDDKERTPTESTVNVHHLHTTTPEAEVVMKNGMNGGDSRSSRERTDSPFQGDKTENELRAKDRQRKRRSRGVEPRDIELEKRVMERFDHLMEKLFFEELGVVPERMREGISPEPVHIPESFPAAWLTINKPRKFKKIIKKISSLPLIMIPEVETEDYSKKNIKATKNLFPPSKQEPKPWVFGVDISERVIHIRPGTPYVDIHAVNTEEVVDDFEADEAKIPIDCFAKQDEAEVTEAEVEDITNMENLENMDDSKMEDTENAGNTVEDDLEDEHYVDDQDDEEIMECFNSESDDDPVGDSPTIDSAQEERELSIEIDAIDVAATLSEAPTVPASQARSLPREIFRSADSLSSDEAADEEVMQVFGRNLVHPDLHLRRSQIVDPYALPSPPMEEKPLSVGISDEEIIDEVTMAEEAIDILDPEPRKPVPVVIPPPIERPARLLDLMPPNLIFEGIDYWGLSEAQMEEALDEVITERERIREELLRPPPKDRHIYQLVHEENQNGSLKEIVEFEFSSSDSESNDIDMSESMSKSASPEKHASAPELSTITVSEEESIATSNVVFTEGSLDINPPTPPPRKEIPLSCRGKKRVENFARWRRDKLIDEAIEDEAWQCLLDYIKCEFHHVSYARKPVVYIPTLNLIRGVPRHMLKTYIDQMRVRRYEENDLLEQLEEQNHLFRLKGIEKPKEVKIVVPEPIPPPESKVKFADPVAIEPIRKYHPVRHAPRRTSILKIHPPNPEVIVPVEPAIEKPVKKKIVGTTKFIFKKTIKKIEEPNPDDTKFPTEEAYTMKNARLFRFTASKHLLRPGTTKFKSRFIYKCRGIPGIIHIAMNEVMVSKEYMKDTALLGGFYFMRSKERIAVLRGVGLCDYKNDQIAELLEARRLAHENPFAIALMSLIMGQGTYTVNFLSRIQRDGWYDHREEDQRAREEADFIVRFFLLFCEYRAESQRIPQYEKDLLRRNLLEKYLVYKQLEDACIFTRCMMAFLMALAYSETKHFVDDVVYCKQVPMMFRVAFATLFCETTPDWQQTLLELLKELSPHDIQRFAFTGVGRHPDSINAILEFAKHTSDVQFASFLLIVGECFDVQPFVKSPRYYEKRAIQLLDPRREIYKYWFALNNEMEGADSREERLKIYPELIKTQSALLGYTLQHDLFHAMKEKARPPMEQAFPVALLYAQTDMKILDQQAYEVMRHYAYVLQITHNWIAAGQVFYVMKQGETNGIEHRFETEVEIACSFCTTTLSYGRAKARQNKRDEKKKLEEARERHMEAQRRRMEQGLAPLPFTGAPKKKGPMKDIPDDVDTKIRAIACLACKKPLPRCAICFNHMFNPIANEDGKRGEQVGFGFAACRRCHHGGHPDHLDIWFRENYRCPVAQCLCECDYDNYWDTLTLHESLDFKLLGAPQLTLGVHQGPPPASPPPPRGSDDEDDQIDEEEEEDEEEKELEFAKKRFCYGRISVD